MKLTTINTGFFKLDGGAMFGVVPKNMWEKLNPPDENNLCQWSMRCLLVETGNRKILIDAGMGDKQGERFRSHFHPHGEDSLISSIRSAGLSPEEITDVFATHFHFDHVGGAVKKDEKGNLVPAFRDATYWSNQAHYDWAYTPNARERASFLHENFVPLKDANQLKMIDIEEGVEFLPDFSIRFTYGHTEAMMLPQIKVGDKTVVFCADLFPSAGHIRLPYIKSYDMRPLETLKEKEILHEEALENNYILFLSHDPMHECATLKRNDRGRVVLDKTMTLAEALSD